MDLLNILKNSISQIGIKEVARRSGIAASTVSRVCSGKVNPSLEVTEKLSAAMGFTLVLQTNSLAPRENRLPWVMDVVHRLRKELKTLGVKHVTVFGSVARRTDGPKSDVDLYLEFANPKISVSKSLKAEGRILEAFGDNSVDIITGLKSEKTLLLKQKIDQEGLRVF